MKIRNGFVSNSSSSSFIVAYKKGEQASEFYKTLKLKLDRPEYKFYELKVSDMIEIKKQEVEELQQGMKWMEEQLELYENFIKDKKNIDAIGLIVRIVQNYERNRRSWVTSHKFNKQLPKEHSYDTKKDFKMDAFVESYKTNEQIVFHTIEDIKYELRGMKVNKEKITDMIKLLEPYALGDSWIIFSADISYGDNLEKIIKESVEDGTFKKIEWKNT